MNAAVLGVLLLAHGGDPGWNAQVAELREQLDARVPTETALGMADAASLQAAVDRLQERGVSRIAAVPLFVQTRSEVLDQTRWELGLAEKPSETYQRAMAAMAAAHAAGGMPAHMRHHMSASSARVKASVPLAFAAALDDDPLVAAILAERARALSKDPARETVVLVAHGPVDDAAVAAWRKSLGSLAAAVKAKGGFAAATFGMLRDDAPPAVRAAAVEDLRARVSAAAKGGRALVVPVLVARGGIEDKIARDLKGLDYAWDGRTLMPHEGFADWALARAKAAF